MSKIIFASLAALAVAGDKTPAEVITEGPKIDLPTAIDGSVSSSGSIQEIMYLEMKENSKPMDSYYINLEIEWLTKGEEWRGDVWVQNYAQFEHFDNPGLLRAVTCDSYFKNSESTETQQVEPYNWIGISLANADNPGFV